MKGIAAGVLVIAAVAVMVSVTVHGSGIGWRLRLYTDKVKGRVPELSWSELFAMTAGRDRFQLGRPLEEGRSLQAAVSNPYTTAEDRRQGADVFHSRCAPCHGTDGSGGHGPSLLRPSYDHGDSEFAIYRVLRDGVPSTAMAPTGLTPVQRWQVIAYLHALKQAAVQAANTQPDMPAIDVSTADLVAAGTKRDEWLTYSGTLTGWRYTNSNELTPRNVSHLRPLWVQQFTSSGTTHESTPLVVGGTMFLTESPSNAVALDARTGNVLWRYDRALPAKLPVCCGWYNRGLAVLGHNVFLATLDAHLLALDARTGQVQWDVEVEKPENGFTMTGAPLAFRDTIVVGMAGGEYGIRGFLAAYQAATGKLLWKFHTIPASGEPGNETWSGDSWASGGGSTWVTGSYDPEADLVYWGVGNPGPDYQGEGRIGDNLYTDSVIALHARTGQLAWYFQFTPHDEHDWDSGQTPILANLEIRGAPRKVICWANRNGFYYVLDRISGEFLGSKPFIKVNWTSGLDANGRPLPARLTRVSEAGELTFPGVAGAANWQPSAFDPQAHLVFVHANEQGSVFTKAMVERVQHADQGFFVGSGAATSGPPITVVRALDAATGEQRWEYYSPPSRAGGYSGLLATGGGLLLGAASGSLFALDSATGRECWKVYLGGNTRAPPISFDLDGHQVVAVWSGRALFLLGI